MSCLLMAAIMAVWVHAMREVPGVATKVYVDDRIVTTTSEEPEERLQEASAQSGRVDAALGLERHPDKSRSASSEQRGRDLLKTAEEVLDKTSDAMEVLGIPHAFGRRRPRAFKPEKLTRVHRRLKRIRWMSSSKWKK